MNGYSAYSSPDAIIYSCTYPSAPDAPTFMSATSSSITVTWSQPKLNGSCPILGFALYINDGLGGTTFTEIDSSTIRNKPEYTTHTATGLTHLGNTYVF